MSVCKLVDLHTVQSCNMHVCTMGISQNTMAKNRMPCVMTYTLTHALNYPFVFVKVLQTFAVCTYPETAKNMLRIDISKVAITRL